MATQQFDENSYRESKKINLQKNLGDFYQEPHWIWIGNGSRRKVTFQIDSKNHLGFFAEKSHKLTEIEKDETAAKEISNLIPHLKNFLKTQEENLFTQAVITLFDNGLDLIFVTKREPNFSQIQKLTEFAKAQNLNISYRIKNQSTPILILRRNQIFYPDFKIDLTSDIFIQATKSGLEAIIKIIKASLKAPYRVADIYSGFGAYSFAICDLVKSISAFEGDEKMVNLINENAAKQNLKSKLKAETRDLFFTPLNAKELKDFDLIIINPPRNGASPQVKEISKSPVKNIIYISCNPESFKRDAKILIDAGFKITNLTAIDQFYATKHLELVSIFTK